MRTAFLGGGIVLAAVIVLMAARTGSRSDTPDNSPAQETGTSGSLPDAVLGVDAFMTGVDRYRDRVVTVEGIVSAISETSLALIDVAEYEACGTLTCARFILPIRWDGKMPQRETRVRVRGRVQEETDQLIFVADGFERNPATSGVD
jgi:hypothetical protein